MHTLLRYLTRGPAWFFATVAGIASLGVIVGILFWGGLHTALAWTDRIEFCISCHEMRTGPFAEYSRTVHYRNASGVRATCADCHVPREWWPRMVRKFQASAELYGHFVTGVIDTPEKYEAHRLTLARRVWARMSATDSHECRNCHSFEAMDPHVQRAAAVTGMDPAQRGNQTCIDCHRGIAHRLPDMSQSMAQAFRDLQEAASREGARGGTLYAISTRPLFMERPAGEPGGPDARLLGGAEVRVLERQGDWLKIRIEGWQQEGAERAVYALRGHRILTAALGGDAVGAVEVLESQTDPDTDLVWKRVGLDAWVNRAGMLGDRQRLASYAAQLYGDACGTCHSAHAPDSHLANQWIGTMNAMRERTSLDDEQYRFLLRYLQLNARDTGGRT